jgi:hypothetical protein
VSGGLPFTFIDPPRKWGTRRFERIFIISSRNGRFLRGVTLAYGALKFFYETTLKRDWEGFRIPKGKTERRLPIDIFSFGKV